MNTLSRNVWLPVLLFCIVVLSPACSNSESKAVGELVKTTTSAVPETQSVGRVLEIISVLEQAEGLNETQQCRAASRIYCEMFQMVRDGCLDTHTQSFCQTVANSFYGGNFPPFGMRVCMSIAGDKCSELVPHEQRLGRLCQTLIAQCR